MMKEILFIVLTLLTNFIWFTFYLVYIGKFPLVKILVCSLIDFIVIILWNGGEYFLQHIIYVIFCSILLGSGFAGFIEYIKNLYKNYRKGNLSFKSIFVILLYVWLCAILGWLKINFINKRMVFLMLYNIRSSLFFYCLCFNKILMN